eukprot:TRINITY_DN130_c0_g1_i2.p1 TRINITY_DN130_c0_g1~~TRINITY_DN130_c0_g1_i2.p1  ORF type:complete len:206 (-),score=19.94 TRINITY_DN130_c0_g1_i2:235-822(-)
MQTQVMLNRVNTRVVYAKSICLCKNQSSLYISTSSRKLQLSQPQTRVHRSRIGYVRAAASEEEETPETITIPQENIEVQPITEAKALYRKIRGSPNKYRRVLNCIRGRKYEDALGMLEFMPYRACENIKKCLLSAAASAQNNYGMKKSKLYVSECYCDMGSKMKRFRPRAQGRAYKILKPTAHLTIKVAELKLEN